MVGSPVANRTRVETEGLIGFFVNTLVLRAATSAATPASASCSAGCARRRSAPTPTRTCRSRSWSRSWRRSATSPTRRSSRCCWCCRTRRCRRSSCPASPWSRSAVDGDSAKFDLRPRPHRDRPTGSPAAGSTTPTSSTAPRPRASPATSQTLLAGVVAEPERAALGAAAARRGRGAAAPRSGTTTAAAYRARRLPARADRGAGGAHARTPPAVLFEGETLTYRELDRAGQRAWRGACAGLGVGPEVRVGIAAERSLELVVGLLAILKAGGAYVPLDPAYPRERLACMLEDARVAGAAHPGAAGGGPAGRMAPGCCSWTAWRAKGPRRRSCRRRAALGRTTWPTSSTPRARPAGPRGR